MPFRVHGQKSWPSWSSGISIGAYEEELLSLGCSIYRIRRPFPIAPWVFDHDFANLCRMTGGFGAVHGHINFASVVLTAARRQNAPIRIAHAHTESSLDTSFLRSIYHALSRKVILRNNTQLFACSDQSGRYLFGEESDTSACSFTMLSTCRGPRCSWAKKCLESAARS